MTNQHPITPPSELVQQCWDELRDETQALDAAKAWGRAIALAYQAGADQELEACCGFIGCEHSVAWSSKLRTARRPKPPSLNSIALQMLGTIERDAHYLPEITDTIRKALEQLND